MRVVIEINTDGDAFKNPNEIYDVLSRERMRFYALHDGCKVCGDPRGSFPLSDRNGNPCGSVTIDDGVTNGPFILVILMQCVAAVVLAALWWYQ